VALQRRPRAQAAAAAACSGCSGGDERVRHTCRGADERSGTPGQHDSPGFLWLTANGNHLDVIRQRVAHDRSDRGDGQTGGHDLELGEPVPHHVAEIGAFLPASRPWFEDMSRAQAPAEAASWAVDLALAPTFDPAFYGELVQFGKVLPWESGVPVPRKATA
jgi:hypothetical protein